MNTKNRHKGLFTLSICFFFSILIAFIILTYELRQQSTESDVAGAEVVLIRKFTLGDAVYPGSRNALFFDDPQQIRKIYSYVKSTRYDNHACAWHYVVEFYNENFELIETYYVNKDCSFYKKQRMKPYFDDIENNPSHYIYDLIIPANIDSKIAINDLKSQNYIPLPLEHPYTNLPKITLNKTFVITTEDSDNISSLCDDEINNMLNEISKEITIVYVDTPYGKGINTGLHTCYARANIYLEADFNLSQLEKMSIQQGAEINEIKLPTAYIIQVINTEFDLQFMKTKIMNQLEYIEDVVPFTQTIFYGVE